MVKTVLQAELPSGYQFSPAQPQIMSAVDEDKTAESADDLIFLNVNASQEIIAPVDLELIKAEILGQPLPKAENYLNNQESLQGYQFTWSNDFYPTLFGSIPANTDKVNLSVAAN